jgi:hypothetical protein
MDDVMKLVGVLVKGWERIFLSRFRSHVYIFGHTYF